MLHTVFLLRKKWEVNHRLSLVSHRSHICLGEVDVILQWDLVSDFLQNKKTANCKTASTISSSLAENKKNLSAQRTRDRAAATVMHRLDCPTVVTDSELTTTTEMAFIVNVPCVSWAFKFRQKNNNVFRAHHLNHTEHHWAKWWCVPLNKTTVKWTSTRYYDSHSCFPAHRLFLPWDISHSIFLSFSLSSLWCKIVCHVPVTAASHSPVTHSVTAESV